MRSYMHRCTHAVSKTAEGPYQFSDVAVGHWCHNPAVVLTSFPNGTQQWALFHIGNGTGGRTANCTGCVCECLSV